MASFKHEARVARDRLWKLQGQSNHLRQLLEDFQAKVIKTTEESSQCVRDIADETSLVIQRDKEGEDDLARERTLSSEGPSSAGNCDQHALLGDDMDSAVSQSRKRSVDYSILKDEFPSWGLAQEEEEE